MQPILKLQPIARYLVLLIAGLAFTTQAAPTFRVNKSYPQLGLNVRSLGNSTPEPLPQPQVYTYTFTPSQGDSYRQDLYSLQELWYATQHTGQWRDTKDNVLILAHAQQLKPAITAQVKDHIPREAFDKAMQAVNGQNEIDSLEKLTRWLQDFTGLGVQTPEKARGGFSIVAAYFFPLSDATTLACAFQPRQRSLSTSTPAAEWFVALVKVADGTPLTRVRKDFETQFLATVSAMPKTGTPSSGATSFQKPTDANPPAAHPSRAAAHRSIANMQGWWHADTPEYTFLTDVRSAVGQRLIRDVQGELTALRRAFIHLVPPLVKELDINIIRIFETAEDYQKYVGADIEWSSGCWSPARRELVIQSQGKDRNQTLSIIRHEAFHQYLFYATDMLPNAMWYNEGHACFFEEVRVDSRGQLTILEGHRLNFLMENLEDVAGNLPRVLKAQHQDFYNGSDRQRQLNYTTAWGLTYFLRKGVPSMQLKAYDSILADYLKHLTTTKDGTAATQQAFEGVDLAGLQRDFTECWRRRRNEMRRFDPLATQGLQR